MECLHPYFPELKAPWTEEAPLPGSDFGARSRVAARDAFFARHPRIPTATLRAIFRRHGTRSDEVVGDGELGEDFGAGLSERELRYFVEHEWARTAEDVLWRRTKYGLHMTAEQRSTAAEAIARLL